MILVAGSSNTDMVIRSERIPAAGETLIGSDFFMNPGGKGANQAVAAARLGGQVIFVARVGKDVFGKSALRHFKAEGIDTQYITEDAALASGVALITLDRYGENTIVVGPGANAGLLPAHVDGALKRVRKKTIVLLQLEIPLQTVAHIAASAAAKSATVILNPAPAQSLSDDLLRSVSILTPNQTEARTLTGIDVHDAATAQQAGQRLLEKGVGIAMVTLGSEGVMVVTREEQFHIPAVKVISVDTTAAGDVFNGALATALSEKMSLKDAVTFGCRAAAISVTRLGAQASAPHRKELSK